MSPLSMSATPLSISGHDEMAGNQNPPMPRVTPIVEALARSTLAQLATELDALRAAMLAEEEQQAEALDRVHPSNRLSARNLIHYLALRRHDLRALQSRLAQVGLSSLGRAEPHVMVALDRMRALLALAVDGSVDGIDTGLAPCGFRQGPALLRCNADALLGPKRPDGGARIMVTIPHTAADDPRFCRDLIRAGMDCARINCAQDEPSTWAAMVANIRAASHEAGRHCSILMDLAGAKVRICAFADDAAFIRVKPGEAILFSLGAGAPVGAPSVPAEWRASCDVRQVFTATEIGASVWIDDGAIGGHVDWKGVDELRVRITHAHPEGTQLRAHKGINLPDTPLLRSALRPTDMVAIDFIARHADGVSLSFAEHDGDVMRLQRELAARGARRVGVVLKIETRAGFENLPRLLLAAMHSPTYGVMIARGDLAVEMGFERLSEVQEEILWVAEAAHAPTIWATQVLETLAGSGVPTRAEVTDAAMAERAEAVMLNKGRYVIEAITFLHGVLTRMEAHVEKKTPLMRPLRITESLGPAAPTR